jgi:acetylornithine deacetylase/succinyl-diaminopimelate desuccinylase-like protein
MAGLSNDLTHEVTDLLQQLIRNQCVNDGTRESGNEWRSADLIGTYLEGSAVDIERYEPAPGRASLVARIEGRRPGAPSLLLMGHTDVVPANPARWRHDPFGGELIDGEVWGRGAIDMLNITASMAVAIRRLATAGFRPEGTLVYLAVADEEALGAWGADHLATHELAAVRADYVLTESGGIPVPGGDGEIRLPVLVAEKGSCWCTLRVSGTPGHASQPYATDNALVTAAAVVQRLAEYRPETRIHETWRRFLDGLGFPDEMVTPLLDPDRLVDALADLPVAMARQFHACTHTTIAPTVAQGGTKTNVIPDQVDLQLDIRTLPGQTLPDVRAMLDDALGDLADRVEVLTAHDDPSTESPVDSPLWDTLARTTQAFYGGSHLLPMLSVGATDARFFRRLGATAYGFGLFSQKLSFEDYGRMFHGDDERVDVESLRLSAELWEAVARDLLGA